jgi:hypothetical protein
MKLKFKNEHIYYALEPVWNDSLFDYKFKTQINQLVVANSDNDFVQGIDITKDLLVFLYEKASQQQEGVAAAINKAIKAELLPQLLELSNNDNDNPNEAYAAIISIQALDAADIEARSAIIEKGKNKILN